MPHAARALGAHPSCQVVDGRAEVTTLPDGCVDLIAVAQTIHWCDPHPTRAEFRRISRPGLRHYVGADEIPRVRSNYGTALLSTPRGVLSSKESRREHVGGEVLCHIW